MFLNPILLNFASVSEIERGVIFNDSSNARGKEFNVLPPKNFIT
jgi:hypothetical protein